MKLNQTRIHKTLGYLKVTPFEEVVLHDPLQPRNEYIKCYKCFVSSCPMDEHVELYTEKYLRNDFRVALKGE